MLISAWSTVFAYVNSCLVVSLSSHTSLTTKDTLVLLSGMGGGDTVPSLISEWADGSVPALQYLNSEDRTGCICAINGCTVHCNEIQCIAIGHDRDAVSECGLIPPLRPLGPKSLKPASHWVGILSHIFILNNCQIFRICHDRKAVFICNPGGAQLQN